MALPVRQRLADDHHAVNVVLEQLLTALANKDVRTSYSKLDLLWARLAVHIRAEHLHLFPAIAPRVSEAQPVIDRLREDHDFFMRELGQAIAVLRDLPKNLVSVSDEQELAAVRDAILDIEKRLVTHNEIEENQIYQWSSTILSEAEQLELRARVNAELEHRPPRFSAEAWANSL